MASGDTNITICNQALNLLGADTISSFSDTSNDAAAVCNNIYETVKRQTLSMYPWSFALTKLPLVTSNSDLMAACPFDRPASSLSFASAMPDKMLGRSSCEVICKSPECGHSLSPRLVMI